MKTKKTPVFFTLIELLVVVAIIGILAAMLLPVLTKARHKAKLTLCTNMLRQNAVAVIMYAGNFDDYYPYRKANMVDAAGSRTGFALKGGGAAADDRPMFLEYLENIDMHFQCPLAPPPSGWTLQDSTADNVTGTYTMWFGGELELNNPDTGMFKVGKHFVSRTKDAAGDLNEFNVLFSDTELNSTNSYIHSAHSLGGRLPAWNWTGTLSQWGGKVLGVRTEMYPYAKGVAFDDGSILRYTGFDRVDLVTAKPNKDQYNHSGSYTWLPPVN